MTNLFNMKLCVVVGLMLVSSSWVWAEAERGPEGGEGHSWHRVDDFQACEFKSLKTPPYQLLMGEDAFWWTPNRKSVFELRVDPVQTANRALRMTRQTPQSLGGMDAIVNTGLLNLPTGRIGTVFLRFMLETDPVESEYIVRLGVGPSAAYAGLRIDKGKGKPAVMKPMGDGQSVPVKPGSWYRLWIVAHNGVGEKATGKILLAEENAGSGNPTLLGTATPAISFDRGTFANIYLQKGPSAAVWIDDVYVDNSGENLSDPMANPPRKLALQKAGVSLSVGASVALAVVPVSESVDALGPTVWFQGMWPTDASMPNPKFPHFVVEPERQDQTGFSIAKQFPCPGDRYLDKYLPKVKLALVGEGRELPLYGGGAGGQIAYRTGNLLRLVDTAGPVKRMVEMAIFSHQCVLLRVRLVGSGDYKLQASVAEITGDSPVALKAGRSVLLPTLRGWHGVELAPGKAAGEGFALLTFDAVSREGAEAALARAGQLANDFDGLWNKLAAPQSLAPFLTGRETPLERNLVAACVNRVLRNARGGGLIVQPSNVEFYGPDWGGADMVWTCFQPATRHGLWIEPSFLGNSMRTLFGQQWADGKVPQMVAQEHVGQTQIPNISPCVRDYYAVTHDRPFLEQLYPRMKKWYAWWLENRNDSGDGIIHMGSTKHGLMSSVYEYKDNPAPNFMPLTRVPGVDGRPELVCLPDIVACQARMAEDIAFVARELGDQEGERHFLSEYHRVKDWANKNLWDEETKFYYAVVRATGKKIMKRSNTVFWLLWAGIPDQRQKDELVKALFDPQQFFTAIPVPLLALNDPSFDPKIGHWGDGYVWPIDVHHAFDGLLRYGEWDKAAKLAEQFNRGVFQAIQGTYQPNEFYHHSGKTAGCAEMGTAGPLPLTFQKYLKDYQAGKAQAEWAKFAPEILK